MCHDQDAFAASALDQLGREHTRLECFTQANCISNQDPRSGLPQRLERRVKLVRHEVHHPAMPHVNTLVVWNASPAHALQKKHRCVVSRAGVRNKRCFGRIEGFNLLLKLRQEKRRSTSDELGYPVTA